MKGELIKVLIKILYMLRLFNLNFLEIIKLTLIKRLFGYSRLSS